MSDSPSTPPKPKSGSLRDRIAAFETKAVNPSPERGPPPRPRPAGFANWKPKQSSPPTSPEALTASSAGIKSSQNAESAPTSGSGSMNATDAKESIARAGGSLKERMAALQGRGGFGAPVAPSISTPRQTKWTPPSQAVTQPAFEEDGEGQNQLQEGTGEEVEGGPVKSNPPSIKSPQLVSKSPPPIVRSPSSAVENDASRVSEEVKEPRENDQGDQDGSTLADEGEGERQRRAVIAARMAKLGGARIGMGPAVYGHAAPIKKPSSPPAAAPEHQAPQVQLFQVGEEASTADDDTSPRPPPAMPMAAIPKRTAPPRRKSAKTTATGVVTSHEASSVLTTADASAAILTSLPTSPPVVDVTAQIIEPIETYGTTEVLEEESKPAEESPANEKQENEEDEELRKKHVAEKLAKMGGVNPFAYAPVRRPSVGSVASAEGATTSSPPSQPVPIEKPASPGSSRPVYADKLPMLRRASGGSTKSFDFSSGTDVRRRISVGPVTSGKPISEVAGGGRRASVGSVKSVPKQEEIQEIVEELEGIVLEDVTSVQSPTQAKMKQPISASDERNAHNSYEDKIDDEYIQSDERTNDDEDDDATPQPLPLLPPVTLPSFQQEDIRRRVDKNDILGVTHPSPPRSPSIPLSSTTIDDAVQRTEKPFSPGISPTSRDPPVDRDGLSGPALPRRAVPQTPEQSACDLDGQNASIDEAEGMGTDEEETGSDLASSTLFVPPPAMAGPALRSNDEESELPLHVPPPSNSTRFFSEEKERGRAYEDTDDESNTSGVALPVRLNVASDDGVGEAVKLKQPLQPDSAPSEPIHAASAEKAGSNCDDDVSHKQEHERGEEHMMEESIHARRHSDDLSQSIYSAAERLVNEIPFFVPPRSSEGRVIRPVPVRSVPGRLSISSPPSSSPQSQQQYYEDEEKEVLDEDEGDPIDPTFHSPIRRTHWEEHVPTQVMTEALSELFIPSSTTSRAPPSAALSPPASSSIDTVELKEPMKIKEEEKSKRQTIAERMAGLGGIKFGAAPDLGRNPPVPSPRKVLSNEFADVVAGEGQGDVPGREKVQLTREHVRGSDDQGNGDENEEEEKSRRERIAAKLVGMGGMRIGMMPMAMPPRQSHVLDSSQPQTVSTSMTTPLPKVPVTTKRSDVSESGTSEDGVKVEVEESEIEEVDYEEVKGELEEDSGEEVPPPPPPRTSMRQETGSFVSSGATSILPTSPMTRPPVPVPGPFKRASVQSTGSKKSQQPVQAQPSEYVLVDEPQMMSEVVEDDAPPPPPARPPHHVPSHTRTSASLADSISSQWELPAVPNSSLGGDLSASWSDALIYEHQPTPPPPHQNAPVPIPPPVAAPVSPSLNVLRLNSDELIAVWGRVGVQICEVATTMHDHSKKTLIGDGTYRGFVDTVLREVPNAAKPESKQFPYGYLVYLQNGGQVQKRASEIMPGDIVEIVDARFKGYKGLGGYQQFVGTGVEGGEGGGPVVGVISELEPKKSKLRVFQANQHVGQQTVESVSYRLDDLKSGLVKVYRVLEAQ